MSLDSLSCKKILLLLTAINIQEKKSTFLLNVYLYLTIKISTIMFISASCKAAITIAPMHLQIFRSFDEFFTMDPELLASPVDI